MSKIVYQKAFMYKSNFTFRLGVVSLVRLRLKYREVVCVGSDLCRTIPCKTVSRHRPSALCLASHTRICRVWVRVCWWCGTQGLNCMLVYCIYDYVYIM